MSHMETFGSSLHMNTHTICTTLEHTHPVPTNEIQSPVLGGVPPTPSGLASKSRTSNSRARLISVNLLLGGRGWLSLAPQRWSGATSRAVAVGASRALATQIQVYISRCEYDYWVPSLTAVTGRTNHYSGDLIDLTEVAQHARST